MNLSRALTLSVIFLPYLARAEDVTVQCPDETEMVCETEHAGKARFTKCHIGEWTSDYIGFIFPNPDRIDPIWDHLSGGDANKWNKRLYNIKGCTYKVRYLDTKNIPQYTNITLKYPSNLYSRCEATDLHDNSMTCTTKAPPVPPRPPEPPRRLIVDCPPASLENFGCRNLGTRAGMYLHRCSTQDHWGNEWESEIYQSKFSRLDLREIQADFLSGNCNIGEPKSCYPRGCLYEATGIYKNEDGSQEEDVSLYLDFKIPQSSYRNCTSQSLHQNSMKCEPAAR